LTRNAVYGWVVELLERDDALAALLRARDEAALGRGRVALVTGEPGIGKTSLVMQFARDLEPGARVLLGSCDDLTIPRPLGPLRDLIGYVSSPLGRAVAGGVPTHELQRLLVEELELPPRPTVLVLEDVHWADDATLDAITVLGRRIASLPALVVLTFRGGEVPPAHPLRTAVGTLRADDAVYIDLAPLSEVAVAALAGGADADAVYAATGGNPFYVTELIAARAAPERPASRLQGQRGSGGGGGASRPVPPDGSSSCRSCPGGWRRRCSTRRCRRGPPPPMSLNDVSCSTSSRDTSGSGTSLRAKRSGPAS